MGVADIHCFRHLDLYRVRIIPRHTANLVIPASDLDPLGSFIVETIQQKVPGEFWLSIGVTVYEPCRVPIVLVQRRRNS